MHERRRVQKLHDSGHAYDVWARGVAADGVGCEQRQSGAHAFAAGSAQIVADVSDDLYVGARLALELRLDQTQLRRDQVEDARRRQLRLFEGGEMTGV